MTYVRSYLVFFITFISLSTFAADEDEPVFTFDTVQVTAEAVDPDHQLLLDTPQSISVIDEEIIEDQQANTLDEILKNDASISNKGNFGASSSFSARGFTLNNSGNYLRNGLLYFYFDAPAVESLEQVEILKGPASFLYGSGSPGGMINFITKKPSNEDFINGGVQAGSWDYYRAYADLNMSTDHNIDYRINVAEENANSFRDVYFKKRQLFDFNADLPLFSNTDTLFTFTYQHTDQPQDTGLVAIGDSVADLPRSSYLNQDWTKTELDTLVASLDSYTDLENDWTLHSALYYQYIERDRIQSNLLLAEDSEGDFRYSMLKRLDTWNYYTTLLELMSTKNILFEQKLLFGMTYDIMNHDILEATPQTSSTYSIYDPPLLAEPDFDSFEDPINITTDNVGIYAQDVIQLHRQWELILGARFDNYQSDSSDLTNSSANHTTPHAALIFKPLYYWSLYTSYSEGFEFNEPVSDSNAINFGEALDPTLSEQIEVGSKLELFNTRLLLTTALFDILRYNQPITEDLNNGDSNDVIVVQRGEQQHQGLEFGAQGIITEEWTMLTSLMWLDARFSENNTPDIAGNRPAGVPSLSVATFSEYKFDNEPLNNFAVNAGLFYEGERYGDDQNTFTLDPYARLDLGGAYYYPLREDKEFIIRLTIENITDEEYFYSYRRTNVTVGQPRSFWLTFEIGN
jgi:iron complex outermembrane recepter protein